jgi:hypothetical protein
METGYLFKQNVVGELGADWSQLLIDDDIDGPMNTKKSLEDGYEADNEVNSDSSDDAGDKIVRQVMSFLQSNLLF